MSRKKRALMMFLPLAVLVFSSLLFTSPNIAEAAEYLDVLEHIAEDIEEIHEDMHKVVYFLRLMSYSSIVMALSLVALVVVVATKK